MRRVTATVFEAVGGRRAVCSGCGVIEAEREVEVFDVELVTAAATIAVVKLIAIVACAEDGAGTGAPAE